MGGTRLNSCPRMPWISVVTHLQSDYPKQQPTTERNTVPKLREIQLRHIGNNQFIQVIIETSILTELQSIHSQQHCCQPFLSWEKPWIPKKEKTKIQIRTLNYQISALECLHFICKSVMLKSKKWANYDISSSVAISCKLCSFCWSFCLWNTYNECRGSLWAVKTNNSTSEYKTTMISIIWF